MVKFGFHEWFEVVVLLSKAVEALEKASTAFPRHGENYRIRDGIDTIEEAKDNIRRGIGIERLISPDRIELFKLVQTLEESFTSSDDIVEDWISGLEAYLGYEHWNTDWAKKLGREILHIVKRWQSMDGDGRRRKPKILLKQIIETIQERVEKHG